MDICLFSQTSDFRESFEAVGVFLGIRIKLPKRSKGKGSRKTTGRTCET